MAGSQLKRLKASLRDQGIIGPQQSKKQKKQNAQDSKARNEKRLQRSEALEGIRQQFNPFEFHMNARGPKFEVTTNKPAADKLVHGRPAVSKSRGEEKRRDTILVDLQRRRKVGGLIDRRFGEHDPNMSMEDKMTERFTQEAVRSHKRHNVFDLEDDDAGQGLTHGGKPLFDGDDEPLQDDFSDDDMSGDESDSAKAERRALKRMRLEEGEGEDEDADQPERKKTKAEVMAEVIAKSKEHKYLRQAAKEEDTDLRAELDKELPELQALLWAKKPQRAELGNARGEKTALEKEYDLSLKQLAADRRAQPTQKMKSEEEKATEDSNRLKEMEAQRLKRMEGMESDEEEEEDGKGKKKDKKAARQALEDGQEDDDQFKLGKGIKLRATATELGFDDEDDFEIDDNLVASGSELDEDEFSEVEDSDEEGSDEEAEDDDDGFTMGLLTGTEAKNLLLQAPTSAKGRDEDGVPYTFAECPQTHEALLATFKGIDLSKIQVAIQRIRALFHPQLDSKNKERLGNFAAALVDHVAFLARSPEPPFAAIESIVRHVHSLAKMFPIEIAQAFRKYIEEQVQSPGLPLETEWLVLLGAMSTTFPTSDHWHQVVTPAALLISRSLQSIPQNLADYATSVYLSIMVLQFQQLSKRYVPELINATLNTLWALAPSATHLALNSPTHEPAAGTRIQKAQEAPVRKLTMPDCRAAHTSNMSAEESNSLKVSILDTTVSVLREAAELWQPKPAFFETFQPALRMLQVLQNKANRAHLPPALIAKLKDAAAFLERLLRMAQMARRPLELHHHRPRPIRTYIPKFEDSFDPHKHYDPDRDRAELAKLKAEHKRERKGAMRELRNDAKFIQREQLRQKKVRDEAYDKKFKRIVAEIQNEEGAASNAYEKEKQARKQSRRR